MAAARRPIRRLLIANRGEVAVRIARACRELGIVPVAVASDADQGAMHARVAEEVAHIGGAAARDSYLRGERVIEAARAHGCDAIHPGYGFLSQNAGFADAVEQAGLIFVGPTGHAMRVMGDKSAARRRMQDAGVPVVPGYQGSGDEPMGELQRAADRVGYPLLVKAAAGGGGRGMRVVNDPADLAEAAAAARREAQSAFGDGRLFLERLVRGARHVEIQVLADAHGNSLHLLERECSVQRRYQKILEESPSPLLDEALRQEMGQAAVRAAQACGYRNAGTVEFLVGDDRSFYFLEMNTRLQVEHPVTELITGLDVVALQLAVAAGEPLPFVQEDVRARGHAIECRINAEDPAQGFAPASGRVLLAAFPSGPGLRVDPGVETGDEVSIHYDSMVAKLLAHAADRDAAIRRVRAALERTVVLGVATNVAFLKDVLDHAVFRAGRATTTFVADHMGDWKPPESPPEEVWIAAAVAQHLNAGHPPASAEGDAQGDLQGPWSRADGFRVGGGG